MRLLGLLLTSTLLTGCSICAPGYLDDYATVGGKWQRVDATTGRVGSILSDPGSTSDGATVISNGDYYQDAAVYQGGVYSDDLGTISSPEIIYEGEIYSPPGSSIPAPVPDPMTNLEDF